MKLALMSSLLIFSASSFSQVIDTIHSVCDTPLTSMEKRVVDATAFLIPAGKVTYNAISDTYNVSTSPLTTYGGLPICGDDQFYAETSVGAGRTAVMIGRDRMMTAPHYSVGFYPTNYVVIFREMHDSLGTCTDFQWANIPSDRVYFPQAAGQTNSYIFPKYDFATFKLDRIISGRKPLKPRRSGGPRESDPLFLTGHYLWSGTKFESEGYFNGILNAGSSYDGSYILKNFHPLDGNSGSPVFNFHDEVIETIVAKTLDGKDAENNGCINFVTQPNSLPVTNGPVVDVEAQIPRGEVKVSPIADVTHIADIGQPLTNPITVYEIRSALDSNQYEILPVSGAVMGGPTLVGSIAPGSYFLSLVTPKAYKLTADISGVTECGIWDMEVNVRDRFHDQSNYLRHHFEVGMQEIEIQPMQGWDVMDLYPPLSQTKSYTLTNTRPTSVSIKIKTYETGALVSRDGWLRVNGKHSETIALAPAGQPGDSEIVVLSINPAASAYARLVAHPAEIKFEYVDEECGVSGPIIFPSSFMLGRQAFEMLDGNLNIQPPTTGDLGEVYPIEIDISGNAGLCIDDINFDFGVIDAFAAGLIEENAEILKLTLVSPDAISYVLWDRISLPYPPAYQRLEQVSFGPHMHTTSVLHLDDEGAPPLGDQLSFLDGKAIDGTWTIQVQLADQPSQMLLPSHGRLTIESRICP